MECNDVRPDAMRRPSSGDERGRSQVPARRSLSHPPGESVEALTDREVPVVAFGWFEADSTVAVRSSGLEVPIDQPGVRARDLMDVTGKRVDGAAMLELLESSPNDQRELIVRVHRIVTVGDAYTSIERSVVLDGLAAKLGDHVVKRASIRNDVDVNLGEGAAVVLEPGEVADSARIQLRSTPHDWQERAVRSLRNACHCRL